MMEHFWLENQAKMLLLFLSSEFLIRRRLDKSDQKRYTFIFLSLNFQSKQKDKALPYKAGG